MSNNPRREWSDDQLEFIGWLIEIAITEWTPDNELHFVELVGNVIGYLEAVFLINTGLRTKLYLTHLVEMKAALEQVWEGWAW